VSGDIEAPSTGGKVTGTLVVSGYAFTPQLRVTAVDVLVDGVAASRAVYGLPRADLCAGPAQGSPNCPGVGFRAALVTGGNAAPTIPNGTHKLQIRVTDESGRLTLLPAEPLLIEVDNPTPVLPDAVLTSPANLERVSGTIRVTGHAWDPDGRILNVTLLVDNVLRTTARYGLPRPEACAALTNVANCPNIGFELDFDTRVLTNGLHRLGILVRDDQGNTVVLPRTTSGGINLYVQN
jgi:hypothetical protein